LLNICHPRESGDGFFIYIHSMDHTCFDGKIIPASQLPIRADNKSYRYGDGLFETMKMINGSIPLSTLHFDRFFAGLQLLEYVIPSLFTPEKLTNEIIKLCEVNHCTSLARIRLSASRGDGGLYDGSDQLHYLIESWPASESINALNENGLVIGIYPLARKSCDSFSNLKSANYLPYVMAAKYAKQNRLNDCLVLNTHDRIADSTIANVFIITKGKILTPPLSEGCVNGVMRRYLLEELSGKSSGWRVEEAQLTPEDILGADEVFLTNAMNGMRWIKQVNDKSYKGNDVAEIDKKLGRSS
jgi:branched-chain amino acid aminotransferase